MTVEAIPVPKTNPPTDIPAELGKIGGFLWSHRWIALAAMLLAGLMLWQGIRLLLGPAVPVDTVKRGALIETVVATGSVQTQFRALIGSQITGTVETVNVDEGQRVTKGQTLVTLEAGELKAGVGQAQGAVAQAEAHMRLLEEVTLPTARQSLKDAQATMTNAEQTYGRAAALTKNGYATRASLDAARAALDVARTQARTAEFQVASAQPGGSDYATGQSQLDQARANLATATARLGYATITAPRDGILITRDVERGSVVQPLLTLLTLAPDGETQLLLAIDERNLGKLALGQKAVASADAYPDQRFDAVVSYINPGVDITRASVEVKLTAPKPPPYLRQDMTVSVDIEVGHSDHALVVPGRSVHDSLSAAPWVMAIRNGKAVKQPVTLGLQGNTQIEILKGVGEGDVIVPATATVQAGDRVRAGSK